MQVLPGHPLADTQTECSSLCSTTKEPSLGGVPRSLSRQLPREQQAGAAAGPGRRGPSTPPPPLRTQTRNHGHTGMYRRPDSTNKFLLRASTQPRAPDLPPSGFEISSYFGPVLNNWARECTAVCIYLPPPGFRIEFLLRASTLTTHHRRVRIRVLHASPPASREGGVTLPRRPRHCPPPPLPRPPGTLAPSPPPPPCRGGTAWPALRLPGTRALPRHPPPCRDGVARARATPRRGTRRSARQAWGEGAGEDSGCVARPRGDVEGRCRGAAAGAACAPGGAPWEGRRAGRGGRPAGCQRRRGREERARWWPRTGKWCWMSAPGPGTSAPACSSSSSTSC